MKHSSAVRDIFLCTALPKVYLVQHLLKYAPNNVHFSFLELCPLRYFIKITGNNELNYRIPT